MAFGISSREELFAIFRTDYAGAQPSKNVSRGSDPYRLGRVISGLAWSCVARLLFFVKIMLPDTAEAEWLERWGGVYDFPRRLPVGSTGVLALRVTGTVGNAVPVDTPLEHEDGTQYKVTTVGAVVGGGGTVDVSVAATSKGLATNKIADEILTFTSPPTGITSAVLVEDLENGLDIETLEEYRVRLLAHIGDPPEGGACHDYIEWAKTIDGVKDAYVWAHRRGAGTIDVAILGYGTGADRIVSSDVTSAVEDYIDSVRPGNVRDFVILTPEDQSQDVDVEIDIDETKYKWDWDDLGTGYAISAHDSGAQTITVPSAPAAVIAGVRLTVLGEEAIVTNRTSDVLTLAFEDDYDGNAVSWFTFTVSTQDIRASGDLVRPVRDAVTKLFNTFGPARSVYSEASWQAELRISKLYAAITDVTGVDDADINTPSASVDPEDTFELDGTIPFLVPGNIKVWKRT